MGVVGADRKGLLPQWCSCVSFFATPVLASSGEETVRHVEVRKEWAPEEVFTSTLGGGIILSFQPKLSKIFVCNKVGISHDV